MYNKSQLGLAISLAIYSTFTPLEVLAEASTETAAEAKAIQTQNIETIVVTANRIEQPISQVLASVQVIDRELIEKLNARDILTVLETQAGIQVNRQGGFGQTASLIVRGLESRYSLVLIDGVRVGSATLGYKSLSTLPLNSVERIEIVKGPRAAQYGSDALAGVINIITRKANGNNIAFTTGPNSYIDVEGTSRINTEFADIALNVGYERTDGFDVLQNDETNFADPDSDGYDNLNLGINLSSYNEKLGQFALIAQYSSGEVEFDNYFDYQESKADKTEFENYFVNVNWAKNIAAFGNKIDFSYSQDQDVTYGLFDLDPDTLALLPTEMSVFETSRYQLDYVANYSFSDAVDVIGGLNWLEERIDVSDVYNTVYDQDARTVQSAFAAANFDNNQFIFNLAGRYDDYQYIDSEQTYNLSGGYYLLDNLVFRLSQSTGFKAPTFNDLYYPGSGNANLKAETSLNREVGLRFDSASVNVDVSIFRNELTNKIAWAPAPTEDNPFRWTPFNIDRARYQGIELSTGFDLFSLNHTLNVSYIDAQKYETDAQATDEFSDLPYVSDQLVRYSVAKQWQSFDFTLSVAYQSAQPTNSSGLLPSQVSWDVAANYYIEPELLVTARIDNIFDQQTTPSEGYGVDVDGDWVNDEFYNYNGSGREVFVGLSYLF